jgi:DNA-binding transcriptional LysR family regulator
MKRSCPLDCLLILDYLPCPTLQAVFSRAIKPMQFRYIGESVIFRNRPMPIDLRLLRQAQALAEHGSFRRAAESLKIAQPTLSRGIKELEDEVGLPLFTRSRAGHEPTDFGRVFLQHAVAVLAGANELDREIAMARGIATGETSVAMGPYVAETLGPRCAARFLDAHPAGRLRILMNDPATAFRSLRAGSVDLAIADHSMLASDDDLEYIARLAPIGGYVIVRAGHPLTGKPAVDIADALDYPFAQVVMLPPRLLKPLLAARRAPPADDTRPTPSFPAVQCPTPHIALRVVAESDAFTFASLGMVRDALERGEVVPLFQAPWLRVEWGLLRSRKRPMSQAARALVEEILRAHTDVLREEAHLAERWSRPPDKLQESNPGSVRA